MTPEDPSVLMQRIKKKTALIVKQQHTADTKGFEDYGGAIGLQRLHNERRALQGQLPPLRIVRG